ncbi:MAG TPA: response regulator [Parafilimonas sp.]|nr:response regulator [Parafilimonas sp.]
MGISEIYRDDIIIFYADDDQDDRDTFTDALNEVYDASKLFTHEDGDDLLNALNNPPPRATIVFVDLNMPGKTGFEVIKEIKNSHNLQDLPIVVVSTSSDEKTIKATKELGANFYIPKPTNYNDLKKSINYALNIDWGTFKPQLYDFVYRYN